MVLRQTAVRRYAEAAFEIATRDKTVDRWRSELETAAAIVVEPKVGHALANPSTPLEERTATVKATFSEIVSPQVLNLIDLMLRRGRIRQLPQLADEFRRLDNLRQGITLATATSALPLSPDEIRVLTERMEQYTGGRIELDVKVDPSLLGGLLVQIGDRLIDGSVRSRLERLRNQLVSGAL
ncbi:MAG: ATP synthase F1 subunit delta [Candidatus Limnocylindrales bacterium]